MKYHLFALLSVLTFTLEAQESPYFKDVMLKTNVLSPFSLGVEFPVKDKFSLEYSFRRAGMFPISRTIYRDERVAIKYHLPLNLVYDKRKSFFFLLGIHHVYRERRKDFSGTGDHEFAELNQNRLVHGLGVRYKRFDFWVAAETVFFERTNHYQLKDKEGNIRSSGIWKSGAGISVGLSINFLNLNRLKSWR